MHPVYEFIVSKGRLTDKNREELRARRGFTDQTIEDFRLFNGGDYLLEMENDLVNTFGEGELISSGIFIPSGSAGRAGISPQLLEDRVIIPYLDKDGKAYFLRPHKMGLERPVEVYHERALSLNDHSSLVLTEGEFKAIAGCQLGFKTIAVPGVSSFADSNFKRLVEFLGKGKIKEVCILFDNEIKNDPQYPNYKPEPIKRYDTEYFSYLLAKGLVNEGIDARIGRLPDTWRVNGKIDIDGALAMGKTADDFKWIMGHAKIPKVFLEDQPKEAKDILLKKLAKKYHRSNIHIDFHRYVATRWRGNKEFEEIISNFVIKILATHETEEGTVREAILVDQFGNRSRSFALPAEPMSQSPVFRQFCLNKGNYVWRGTQDDLCSIWEGEFFEDDGRRIVEPDHVGWLQNEKVFMFGNVLITADGEEIRPDSSNIFWIKDKGYKPVPVSITTGKGEISEGIPYLNVMPFDVYDLRLRFEETVGKYEAAMILGWMAAFAFMEDVFQAYGCFPFLFVTGRRGSGKSTVAEWILSLFGIEGGGKMASDTTAVAMQRYLSYYSSLPLFVDEYRNTKNITIKNGFLRNAYNRQSAGKGIRAAFGIREAKIRGGLIVAGEETPEDNALLTRCIVISVSKKKRKMNHFNWFQANKIKFSAAMYQILKKKKELLKDFINDLGDGKEFFVNQGLDDRTAINYSIVGSGYAALFGELPDDFRRYLAQETARVEGEYEKEQAVSIFLEDLLAMQSSGVLRRSLWDADEDFIYIYFHGIYQLWAQEFRKSRGIEPFKSSAIRDYLREEDGFVDIEKQKTMGGMVRRCIVFSKNEAPVELKELVSQVSTVNS
ncbi:MAG: protein of unknown function DUF927 [Siphoviridae sp. ctCJE6]|nr:MAG: protein of unknown function DUF927 [Siphoviridae sp. ctCJE6]